MLLRTRKFFSYFFAVIFVSSLSFTYSFAGSYDQNKLPYSEEVSDLVDLVPVVANDTLNLYKPLALDTLKNVENIYNVSVGILEKVANTGDIVYKSYLYGIDNTGESLVNIVQDINNIPKLANVSNGLNFNIDPRKVYNSFDFVGNSFLESVQEVSKATYKSWVGALEVTKSLSLSLYKNISEAHVALGRAGYDGVANVFKATELVSEPVLVGHSLFLEKFGDAILDSFLFTKSLSKGLINTTKSVYRFYDYSVTGISKSLTDSQKTMLSGVGSVWAYFIDKISEPLVPLFTDESFREVYVEPIRKDINKPVSKIEPVVNTNDSKNSVTNTTITRIIELPPYNFNSSLNLLRQELVSLNNASYQKLRDLMDKQEYKSAQVSSGSDKLVEVTNGGTGLTLTPSYGQLLVGNSSGGYTLTATSSLGISSGSGSVSSVGLSVPTGLSVSGGPITSSGTLAVSLDSGYTIPLVASTTEWDSAYTSRITSASSPLSISNNVISLSTAGDWSGTFDGQEGSYFLNASNLTNFGSPFYTYFNATTTDALTEGSTNKYYSNTLVNSFINSSTTIAKLFSNNTWTGTNIFNNVLTAPKFVASSANATSTFAGALQIGSITPGSYADKNTLAISGNGAWFDFTDGVDTTSLMVMDTRNNIGMYLSSSYNDVLSISGSGDEQIFKISGSPASSNSLIKFGFTNGSGADDFVFTADESNAKYTFTGGNVGVGTTTPWGQLSINPNGISGPVLVVGSSTATRFIVTNGGNVGIGLTSPAVKLDVISNSNSRFRVANSSTDSSSAPTTIGTAYYLRLGGQEYTTNSYRLIGFGYGDISIAGNQAPAYIGYQEKNSTGYTNGDLIFGTRNSLGATDAPTERMRIMASGDIGIGTSTPWGQLSINPNGISGPALVVGSSTATSFVVTNGGNVGVNVSSPTTKLQVLSTSEQLRLNYDLTKYGSLTVNSTGALNISSSIGYVTFGAQVAQYYQYYALADNGQIGWTQYTNNATAGIFDIGLARNANGVLEVNNGTKGTFRDLIVRNLSAGSSTPWGQLSINPNGISGPALVVGSSTATSFVVTNGGKVGIGLTNPTALLNINSGTNSVLSVTSSGIATVGTAGTLAGKIVVGQAASVNGNITIGGTVNQVISGTQNSLGTTWQIVTDNNGSGGPAEFRLGSTGQVGFGNTTSNIGTIDSNISRIGAGIIGIGTGTNGSVAGTLLSSKMGIGTSTPWGQLSINPNGISGPALVVGSSTATSFVVTNGGKVGIGTASPTNPLTIGFTGDASTINFSAGTSINTTLGAMTLRNYSSGISEIDTPKQFSINFNAGSNTGATRLFKINYGSSGTNAFTIVGGTDQTNAGYVGVASTSPWRTFSVTGTVGFDGLTGATGAGSLCLSSNKEIVYNSGSDSCLPSLRETKHDINELSFNASDLIGRLNSVSFVYNNDASSTVRYGFIAEDAASVDEHFATYDAYGKISGIDDRSLISVLVKGFKELKAIIDSMALWFEGGKLKVQNDICVDDVCVTKEQFKQLLINNGGTMNDSNTPITDGNNTDGDTGQTSTTTNDGGNENDEPIIEQPDNTPDNQNPEPEPEPEPAPEPEPPTETTSGTPSL